MSLRAPRQHDKRARHVNVDEPAARDWYAGRGGYVAVPPARTKPEVLEKEHTRPLGKQRRWCTFMACVPDDAEVQTLLPPLVRRNKHPHSRGVPTRGLARLRA